MPRRGDRIPKLMTPELQADICAAIAGGTPWLTAHRAAGVSRESAFRWRRLGARARTGPYRRHEILVRRAERAHARQRAKAVEARMRQQFDGMQPDVQVFLSDPEAQAAEIAKIHAMPQNRHTRALLHQLQSLITSVQPCPTRELLGAFSDAGEDGDADDDDLLPWKLLDREGLFLRQHLARWQSLVLDPTPAEGA